jgi:hypothetical protein
MFVSETRVNDCIQTYILVYMGPTVQASGNATLLVKSMILTFRERERERVIIFFITLKTKCAIFDDFLTFILIMPDQQFQFQILISSFRS